MSGKSSTFADNFKWMNIMRRTISLFLVGLMLCAGVQPAFSWGQKGHRIIAKIAYDNLHRKARKAVDKILGPQGMIYNANWADEIKSDNIYPQSIKDGWHFQDFEGGLSDSIVADALTHYPSEGGSLFRVLDSLELEMITEKYSESNADHILRFLVHLNSDRYCPMHIAHMSDRGGNDVKMKWFGRETRLHAVWDTDLIESQGYSYTEYAQMLQNTFRDSKKRIEQMSDEQLLVECYHMTDAIYKYQEIWDGNTYHYIYTWREPMEEQLYIAGIRLAKLLNEIYK